MSHLAEIKLQITDLDALAAAARELGGQLVRGVTSHEWYNRSVGDYPLPQGFTAEMLGHCEHVIRFPGIRYEVGVYRARQGAGYIAMFDHYGSSYGNHDGDKLAEKLGGITAPKLVDHYGAHKVQRWAASKGYQSRRVIAQNGRLTVQITAP